MTTLPTLYLRKCTLFHINKEDIYEYFDFDPEPLGQGSFGTVYRATEKATGEVRAVKQIGIAHIKDKRYD